MYSNLTRAFTNVKHPVDFALAYASLGWPVFMLPPNSKKPFADSHGFKDAVTCEHTVKRWWTDHATAGIGIATGKPSKLIVIDADIHKTGCEWSELEREHSQPQTFTVRSPHGGLHFYFRLPKGTDIRNSQSAVGQHVDVRGNGGYSVAACTTVDGCQYRILNFCKPAALPDWLLNKLTAVQTRQRFTATDGYKTSSNLSYLSLQCVADAVSLSLPSAPHQNHGRLLHLARGLKTVELARSAPLTPQEISDAFDSWHSQASGLGFLRAEQDKDVYWGEFLDTLGRVRFPLGLGPIGPAWQLAQTHPAPVEAKYFQNSKAKLLLSLCWQLHLASKGFAWFLPIPTAARLLGAPETSVGFWLRGFIALGILKITEAYRDRRARRFVYIPSR